MQRWVWTSLLALGVASGAIGCGGGGSYKPVAELPADEHGDEHHQHGHGAEGPHHGSLVELGEEEFHAEIVIDADAHAVKLYLLGPDAKTAATTAATEATLAMESGPTLTLKPAADQAEGQVSVFELVDEKIVHDVIDAGFIHGQLKLKVNDKDYAAGVDAHFHIEHDHAHGESSKTPAGEQTPAEGAAEAAPPADAPAAE